MCIRDSISTEYGYLLQKLMDDSIYFIFSIDGPFIYWYSINHQEDEVNFIIVQFTGSIANCKFCPKRRTACKRRN